MRKQKSRGSRVLPLGIKNRVRTELPALVALTAIGESWFSPEHQSDLLAVALVVRELAPEESLEARSAIELQQLCEHEVTLEKKVDIALNLADCLPWLQLQPNHRVENAIRAVAARHLSLAA